VSARTRLVLRVGLPVLVAAALIAAGGRRAVDTVWAGVQQGAMIALVALGYTMVYGILVLAGALGVLVEKIAYAPLRARSRGKTNTNTRITPLVTALGMSVLLQNLAQLLFSARYRSYPQILPIENVRIIVFVVAVVVMTALQFLVYGTWFGKAMRALSVNMEAARLMGIRTSRVISMTFVTGSMLAAVGAVLYCLSQSQVYPTMGVVIGTRSFVAAVIGGIGSIPGAMLGGVLIGVIGELTKLTPYSGLQDVIIFAVLIIVLLVRPSGLLGKAGIEKV
jgi:branched-chain amino acid transport system permease protein